MERGEVEERFDLLGSSSEVELRLSSSSTSRRFSCPLLLLLLHASAQGRLPKGVASSGRPSEVG